MATKGIQWEKFLLHELVISPDTPCPVMGEILIHPPFNLSANNQTTWPINIFWQGLSFKYDVGLELTAVTSTSKHHSKTRLLRSRGFYWNAFRPFEIYGSTVRKIKIYWCLVRIANAWNIVIVNLTLVNNKALIIQQFGIIIPWQPLGNCCPTADW